MKAARLHITHHKKTNDTNVMQSQYNKEMSVKKALTEQFKLTEAMIDNTEVKITGIGLGTTLHLIDRVKILNITTFYYE